MQIMVLLTSPQMNVHTLDKDIPFILLDKLNGPTIQLMTNLSKSTENYAMRTFEAPWSCVKSGLTKELLWLKRIM